jgi:hypothetical protein
MRPFLCCLAVGLAGAASAGAQTMNVTVTGGKDDQTNVIVRVPVAIPMFGFGGPVKPETPVLVKPAEGDPLPGQIARMGLGYTGAPVFPIGKNDVQGEVVFVLPKLAAGQSLPVTLLLGEKPAKPAAGFAWTVGKEVDELKLGDRPVLKYMHAPLDASTPQRKMETMKPFHHLYDPKGERLVTKGPEGEGKDFPHHRGLFFGFNKVSYDGKAADVWHNNKGESQTHAEQISQEAGPVLGRHTVLVHWNGQDGEKFADEGREVTAFAVPGGTLVEFASDVWTNKPLVKLDGDPQHAGFHFRAALEVMRETKKDTYYLRPDGKDKPGATRNWSAKEPDKRTVNLPWDAMSFVVGGKRYTALYLDNPKNPKESRGSERDYGRFGNYFEYELTPTKRLLVRYRVWLQEGEMTVAQCEALSKAFVDPPAVKVVAK